MVRSKGRFSTFVIQQTLLLTLYILIENTFCLSLDSLHETRSPEDENFKMALDSIHHRRNMAEKRRYHFENRFTKKDEQNDEDYDAKNYRPLNAVYSPVLSRNIQRFLSEIDDDEDVIKRKRDRNEKKYEISQEEELKPDVTTYDGRRKKSHKRQFDTDMEGPSRIFAHKSSPVSNNMEDSSELPINNDSKHSEGKHSLLTPKRRKKGKSDIFNYARGMEHYSSFWDPEKARERFQRKRNFRSNYGDSSFTKRKRFDKRKLYPEKSGLSSHTNVKRSRDNKEQILGELKEIFKDENEDKREIKKRENDKESGNEISETKLDNSSDTQGQEKVLENRENSINSIIEKNVKTSKEAGDKFNQWLRDEYFKTMAMTMASTKKKRSGWAPIVSNDFDDFSSPVFSTNEDIDDEKSQKFQAIDEKLKTIESAMLSDALQLIREGAEERIGSEEFGQKILDKLYAANDVQKLREALDHLQGSMNKMKRYDDDDDDEDNLENNGSFESDETVSNWPNVIPRKREEDLAKALRVMAPYQSKRQQYSLPNGLESYLPRISMRSLRSFNPDENSSGQLVPVFSPENIFNGEMDGDDMMDADTTDISNCPALDLLSSDCSILGDIVPGGPLKRLVLEACNWHEVCYTCGDSFGLSADDCDIGFVEESKTICQDDIPCQTTAKMMMLPLRQRRIFFKRSVPAVCHRDPCVERFLKHG